LAEIRNFSSSKQVTDRNIYNKKVSQHKFFKASRVGAFIIIIACIAIAGFIWQTNRIYTEYTIKSEVDFSLSETTNCLFLGDSIFQYSMDGANCTSKDGVQVWNQMYQMQKPIIDICQNVVAIGDYNGNTIYIMDDTSVLGSFSTGLPIMEISVSANGLVAAVLEDTNVTWIYLYNAKGEELAYFKTTMEISGYPEAIDISEDGTLIGISYLFMNKDSFSSNIAFYNFGDVGSNYQNNMVSAYTYTTYGQVIPFLKFSNKEESYAVGNDAIISYTSDQIPKQNAATILEKEIISVYYGRNNVGIVTFNDEGEEKYRLEIYNAEGKQVCTHPFDMEFKEILLEENRFIIYSEEQCRIYSMSNTLKFETIFAEPILCMKMNLGKASGTIVTNDKIYEITLK
jgi:hypothetical protein